MSLIPLVEKDGANEVQADILAKAPPPNVFKALLHSPGLTMLIAQLGGSILYKTKLDARMREAAILRLAHMTGCEYEIVHHRHVGRDVGLTESDLAALENGDLKPLEASIGLAVKWAQEALVDGRASRELVGTVVDQLGAEQAVELAVVVGYYTLLSQVLKSFEVPVEVGSAAPLIDIDERPSALD